MSMSFARILVRTFFRRVLNSPMLNGYPKFLLADGLSAIEFSPYYGRPILEQRPGSANARKARKIEKNQ